MAHVATANCRTASVTVGGNQMRKLLSATVITLSLGVAATSCGQEADVSASQDTDTSAPRFEDGLAAYRSADYSTALSIFQPLADQGDVAAQFDLGVMYADGRGVPQDDSEAARLFRLAAEQGHAVAQMVLGGMYANGRGVPQDLEEAERLLGLAADQGLIERDTEVDAP